MANIYEISEEYLRITDAIERYAADNEGEVDSDLLDELVNIEGDLNNKMASYYKLIRMMQADIAFAATEIERITAIKRSKEAAVAKIKERVVDFMKFFDIRNTNSKSNNYSYDCGIGKFYTTNVKSVDIDEDAIDETDEHTVSLGFYTTSSKIDYRIKNEVVSAIIKYYQEHPDYEFQDVENIVDSFKLGFSKTVLKQYMESTGEELPFAKIVNKDVLNMR